jgi:uncharacterized protein YndB with AHSA1/START domain
MSPDFPLEMLVTVLFEDQDGKTKVTLKHSRLPATTEGQGAQQGWNESFDKLVAVLGQTRRSGYGRD